VVLTTGSDEHGQNVERAAKAAGMTPEEYATRVAGEFTRNGKARIESIIFIRTSDPAHHEVFAVCLPGAWKTRYISRAPTPASTVFSRRAVRDDAQARRPCPDCGRLTETVTEENFSSASPRFRTAARALRKNPNFIQPDIAANELIAFVKAA